MWEQPLARSAAALAVFPEERATGAIMYCGGVQERSMANTTKRLQDDWRAATSPTRRPQTPGGVRRPQTAYRSVFPRPTGHTAYRRPAVEARDGLRRPPSAPSLLGHSHPPVIAGGARRTVPVKDMLDYSTKLAGIAIDSSRGLGTHREAYDNMCQSIEDAKRYQTKVAHAIHHKPASSPRSRSSSASRVRGLTSAQWQVDTEAGRHE